MNRRRIVVLARMVIFGFLGWITYSGIGSLKEKEEKESISGSLSEMFTALGIDAQIPKGSTMLIYFNSECEHCRWEIQQLSKGIDQFAETNIAMFSLEPGDSAYHFLEKHALQQYFIEVSPENIMSAFSGGVPQIFVYEGDELKKKFRGEVKIEVLLDAIK